MIIRRVTHWPFVAELEAGRGLTLARFRKRISGSEKKRDQTSQKKTRLLTSPAFLNVAKERRSNPREAVPQMALTQGMNKVTE